MENSTDTDSRSQLVSELKNLVVEVLNLDDVEPSDIQDDEPLFGTGLALDSIDALELVVSLEKKYKIKIGSSEESKTALASISTLADLIEQKRS